MKNTLFSQTLEITSQDITNYLELLKNNPIKIVTLILDISIVIFLIVKLIEIVRENKSMAINKRNSISNNCNIN